MKKLILITILSAISTVWANASGTTGGKTLLQPTSARPAALGEAFSAVSNDIAAFGYNPASLNSLGNGQASFMYEKGLAEDSFGHFAIGAPLKRGSFGFSFGYYNGGKIDLYNGSEDVTVNSKTDLNFSLGYAGEIGKVSMGVTAKYISSELIETEKATAYAADFGMQVPLNSRIRFGAAVQNIGTQLKYIDEGDNLPRIARAGLSFSMFQKSVAPTILLLDAPYYVNDKKTNPAVGLETSVGPLALRAGYKTGNDLAALSFGAGFLLGRMSLDYSYGLVDDIADAHRVSLGVGFGEAQP